MSKFLSNSPDLQLSERTSSFLLFFEDILLLNLQQFIFLTFPQVKARFGNLQGKEQIFTFHFARMKLILLEGRRLCFSIGSRVKEEKEEKENKAQNHSSHSMLHLEAQHAWEEVFPKLCISLDCTLATTTQHNSDHIKPSTCRKEGAKLSST